MYYNSRCARPDGRAERRDRKLPGAVVLLLATLVFTGCDLLFPPPAPEFSVRYEGNGHSSGEPPVDAATYPEGAVVTVADRGTLARTGYRFAGWNTSADGSGVNRDAGSTFAMGAEDHVLHARWTEDIDLPPVVADRIDMVEVQGGTTFYMGVAGAEWEWVKRVDGRWPGHDPSETPRHPVRVSTFLIGKYEITQAQFRSVMGYNISPPHHRELSHADFRPANGVDWYSAVRFCNALSVREGFDPVYGIDAMPLVTVDFSRNGYRLPTEAEWEYAAEGGNRTMGHTYSGAGRWDAPDQGLAELGTVAWYARNSGNVPRIVGTKLPNELGIHDMSGNVWEWSTNFLYSYRASDIPAVDPVGARPVAGGNNPMLKGGTYSSLGQNCRVSLRGAVPPGTEPKPELPLVNSGFRVVRRP